MTRYTISHINNRFQVSDRQLPGVNIVNDQGTYADNTDPAQMKFFGMTLEEAQVLRDQLEAKRTA